MERIEKLKLAIKLGYKYNPETGIITNRYDRELKATNVYGYSVITIKKKVILYGHQFAWYWVNKEIVDCIDHINRIKNDNRIENLRSVTSKENTKNTDIINMNKLNGKIRYDKTNEELKLIIYSWDFNNGKITQKKISELSGKSIRTIKYHWKDLITLALKTNKEYFKKK